MNSDIPKIESKDSTTGSARLPVKRQTSISAKGYRMEHCTEDKLPGASSSPAVSPSNNQSNSIVLPELGFHWDLMKMKAEVETCSYALSFDDEWKKFMKVVVKITGTHSKCRETTVGNAWNCFKNVIAPSSLGGTNGDESVGAKYDKEEIFDDALFTALRKSLEGFIEKKPGKIGDKWIVLLDSHIGFGRKIGRTTLGFMPGYALLSDSVPDHGCFVLGTNTMKALNIAATEVPEKKRKTTDIKEVFWFNDVTSVVELKLQKTSCLNFENKSNKIKTPDFAGKHGPMGQAMLYSMDVWHCLARRGVVVEKVPVVVLAGKSKVADGKHELCCLHAHVKIPKDCGQGFVYSIDELVAFNGTAGFQLNDVGNTSVYEEFKESRDKRAIAIYIKTMRIGLENALEVIRKCNLSDPVVVPVSLGCYPMLQVEAKAELVASPIPRETRFYDSKLQVHQGELFRLENPTKSSFAGFRDAVIWFTDNDQFNHDCLVKVSCLSVHNTYISHSDCQKALTKLRDACIENADLRKSISKVLLGYCYVEKSKSLVSIMRDLQKENFKLLDHQTMHDQCYLPKLWSAFSLLVQSLLLPMAEKGIVHYDIRSSREFTYNILVCNEKDKLELCLIDFESLILYESAIRDDLMEHDDAVHMKDLCETVSEEIEWESAHRYLFWQVL